MQHVPRRDIRAAGLGSVRHLPRWHIRHEYSSVVVPVLLCWTVFAWWQRAVWYVIVNIGIAVLVCEFVTTRIANCLGSSFLSDPGIAVRVTSELPAWSVLGTRRGCVQPLSSGQLLRSQRVVDLQRVRFWPVHCSAWQHGLHGVQRRPIQRRRRNTMQQLLCGPHCCLPWHWHVHAVCRWSVHVHCRPGCVYDVWAWD